MFKIKTYLFFQLGLFSFMNQFVFIKPFSFYEKFKKKQNIENFAQKKVSTRSRGISYSETLTCKENKLSKKVDEYINCLPTSFVKDQDAPPPFSYSWLQRIGRMDIFSEKIENKTSEGKEFSSYDFFKTDPIFRLPKKKKKKITHKELRFNYR